MPVGQSEDFGLFDHDVVNRHVTVEAVRGGGNAGDFIDDVLAGRDLAEDGVAPTLRVRSRVVQEVVVDDVDEELGRRGVRGGRTGHGDGVLVVLETVGGFVFDRGAGGLLLHASFEAAALDHEALDDAMEDRAVVEAVADVLFEVGGTLGSVFVIELDVDHALVGRKANHCLVSLKT